MVSIGRLTALIDADASGFRKEFLAATSSTDRLDLALGKFATTTAVAAATAAAAVAASIIALTNAQARYHAELSLGAGIAGLTIADYEALQRTADALGASHDLFADVVNDVSERLQDAREGVQTYADAFRRLGIDIEDFARQDRVNRLFTLAEALQSVSADAAQLSANELAGDQGQRFLSFLNSLPDGAAGLEELARSMRSLELGSEAASDGLRDWRIAVTQARGAGQELLDVVAPLALALLDLQAVGSTRVALSGGDATFDAELIRVGGQIDFTIDPVLEAINAFELESNDLIPSLTAAELAFNRYNVLLQEQVGIISTLPTDGLTDVERFNLERARALGDDPFERAVNSLEDLDDVLDPADYESVATSIAQANSNTAIWGGAINSVIASAIAGTQDWGSVILSVLSQALQASIAGGLFGGGRQHGGPVFGGRAYVVGEDGPELFVPQASGSIVPSGQFGGLTFNVAAGVNEDQVRRFFFQEALPIIREQTATDASQRSRRG